MANWESLKRAQEATYESAACGDPTLEMSGPWDAHQEGVEWNWPDLRRKPALCADGRVRQRRTQKIMNEPQVPEDTKDHLRRENFDWGINSIRSAFSSLMTDVLRSSSLWAEQTLGWWLDKKAN